MNFEDEDSYMENQFYKAMVKAIPSSFFISKKCPLCGGELKRGCMPDYTYMDFCVNSLDEDGMTFSDIGCDYIDIHTDDFDDYGIYADDVV